MKGVEKGEGGGEVGEERERSGRRRRGGGGVEKGGRMEGEVNVKHETTIYMQLN